MIVIDKAKRVAIVTFFVLFATLLINERINKCSLMSINFVVEIEDITSSGIYVKGFGTVAQAMGRQFHIDLYNIPDIRDVNNNTIAISDLKEGEMLMIEVIAHEFEIYSTKFIEKISSIRWLGMNGGIR